MTKANGGAGYQHDGGLSPGTCERQAAHLTWRGPQTITIDFVQFADGSVWFSSDPQSLVTPSGLDTGTRAAADHLLRVWREGGKPGLAAALPVIHRDVQDDPASWPEDGRAAVMSGFYAGVTRAAVVMSRASDEDVEETLLALGSASAE